MIWFIIAFIVLVIIIFLDYFRKDINEGESKLSGLHNGLKESGFYKNVGPFLLFGLLGSLILGFNILNDKYELNWNIILPYAAWIFLGIWALFSIWEASYYLISIRKERRGKKNEGAKKYYKELDKRFPRKKLKFYGNLSTLIFLILMTATILINVIKPFGLELNKLLYLSLIIFEVAIILNSLLNITTNTLTYQDCLIVWIILILSFAPYIQIGIAILLPPSSWFIIVSIVGRNQSNLDTFDRAYLTDNYYSGGVTGRDCNSDLPSRFNNYANVGDGWIDGQRTYNMNLFPFFIILGVWGWFYCSFLL